MKYLCLVGHECSIHIVSVLAHFHYNTRRSLDETLSTYIRHKRLKKKWPVQWSSDLCLGQRTEAVHRGRQVVFGLIHAIIKIQRCT